MLKFVLLTRVDDYLSSITDPIILEGSSVVHDEHIVYGVLVIAYLLSWYQQVTHDDILQYSGNTTVNASCPVLVSSEGNRYPVGES